MAVLGVGLAAMLAFANKALRVFEDPRVDEVEALLPGVNCGACGFPGCRGLATALIAGEAAPGRCTVNPSDKTHAIAALLGVDADIQEKRVARLACAGGRNVAHWDAEYQGLPNCRAAALVAGGGKSCAWGCLGYGDCVNACAFNALTLNDNALPIVDENACTACGQCVAACPRNLFSLHPISHQLWVACQNRAPRPQAQPACAVACIGCGRCKMDAAPGLIQIVDSLAVVDYAKNEDASMAAIDGCPTGAIVWMDPEHGPVKGARAQKASVPDQVPVA